MKDLARKSYESYKSHKLTSWILGLFCGLVLTGLVILCMIDTLLLIIIVPFVLLPFLFACHMLHLSLAYEQTLTLSSFGRFFTMYFRHPFRGVFNFFQSLLRYVIASLICEAVFGLVSYIVCVSIDQSSFYQMINTFMELMMSSEGVSDLKVALGDNYSMYLIFMNVSTIPASIVSFIYFAVCFGLSRIAKKITDKPFLRQMTCRNRVYQRSDHWDCCPVCGRCGWYCR